MECRLGYGIWGWVRSDWTALRAAEWDTVQGVFILYFLILLVLYLIYLFYTIWPLHF